MIRELYFLDIKKRAHNIFYISKKHLILILLISIVIGNNNDKFRLSMGLFNERLGMNFINISYLFHQNNSTEIFVTGGTMLMASSIGLGLKYYYNKNNDVLLPFSGIAVFQRYGNRMGVVNGNSIRTDNCIGLSSGVRFNLNESLDNHFYFQIGVHATADFRNKIQFLPFLNLEFKY